MKNIFLFSFLICSFCHSQETVWDQMIPFTTENIKDFVNNKGKIILIDDLIPVQDNVIIPNDATLRFSASGKLRIVNEESRLKILGLIDANAQQIFDISARGVVTYNTESKSNILMQNNKVFYPEWWGIFPNVIPRRNQGEKPSAINYTYTKEMMLDVAASGGGEIKFSTGTYFIRDIVIDFSNVTISGAGKKKTILQFDRKNHKYSTRRGGIFTIQGPTKEKYYNKKFPDGVYQAGNFLFDGKQETIENIVVKNLSVSWDKIAAKEDPAMNGLSVVNAKGVVIDNVHVNLYGANRAFYIATLFNKDISEDITIKNSSCEKSRTGVFILHGFDEKENRESMSIGNVLIENNHFKVSPLKEIDIKNEQISVEYLDIYSAGIFFSGSEYTSSFTKGKIEINRRIGSFIIKGNIIENADFGIRSWLPYRDKNKGYIHKLKIEDNTFLNYNYTGVFCPFSSASIINNIFETNGLSKLSVQVKKEEEGFIASAIHVAKAPWKFYKTKHGPDTIIVKGNKVRGCFLGTTPVIIQPNKNGKITISDNTFKYDESCQIPVNDIVVSTSQRKFRTKKALIDIKNNLRIGSNESFEDVSLKIDAKRKKHITIIEK